MTAALRRPVYRAQWTHTRRTARPPRVLGREISARHCWKPEKPLFVQQEGAVFQTGQVTREGQLSE